MEHHEKIGWMALWAVHNSCAVELNGEVGFGRQCVGIIKDGSYPDYDDISHELEVAGKVFFTPEDAYHKSPCIAVLGRGQEAEEQLYEWLKFLDDNGITVSSAPASNIGDMHMIQILMGQHIDVKLVRKEKA